MNSSRFHDFKIKRKLITTYIYYSVSEPCAPVRHMKTQCFLTMIFRAFDSFSMNSKSKETYLQLSPSVFPKASEVHRMPKQMIIANFGRNGFEA